jgi:nucleoside-diphosphate-sugar epimerase
VGNENLSISDIAKIVQHNVQKKIKKKILIEKTFTNDNRSYHVNSEFIFEKLGFKPKLTIKSAIDELVLHFKKGNIANPMLNTNYYNVKKMKKLNFK